MSSLLLPLIIFLARIADVSLGTLRITMVSRGLKFRAAVLGFFEVLIWAIIVTQLLQNLNNWINYVAYASGFAAGTYMGMMIEDKLKVGTILLRIITRDKSEELTQALKGAGVGVTSLEGKGSFSEVKIIFTIMKRRKWKEVISMIEAIDPDAFYSAEDVKFASKEAEFSVPQPSINSFDRLLRLRKGI